MPETSTETKLAAHGSVDEVSAGFALCHPPGQGLSEWLVQSCNQILYAFTGYIHVETLSSRHFISQGRAAWIPAGVVHRTVRTGLDSRSIFIPTAIGPSLETVAVFAGGQLLREFVAYASSPAKTSPDRVEIPEDILKALSFLCAGWIGRECDCSLSTSSHPRLRRAMDYAANDLSGATQEGAAQAAATSVRTLRRLCQQELGEGWHSWLCAARMSVAMSLLEDGHRVTDVAADVGYASMSAFAKGFSQKFGILPSKVHR